MLKRFAPIAGAIALTLTLAACSGGGSDAGRSACFAFQDLETQFWVAGYEEIKTSLSERGFIVIERNANEDANRQLEQVKDCIVQGVEGVVIIPQDGDSAAAIVKEAQSNDVPIVVFNRPPSDMTKGMIVVADNVAIARSAVEAMVVEAEKRFAATGKKLKPMILVGALGDSNAVDRRKGFMDVVSARPDLFETPVEVPTEWDAATALANFEAAITANPKVDFIFTSSDFLFPTIRSVLEPRGLWKKRDEAGHVIMGGLDGDSTACALIEEGYVDATGVQDLGFEADTSVKMLVEAIDAGDFQRNAVVQDPGFALSAANFAEKSGQTWGCKMRTDGGAK